LDKVSVHASHKATGRGWRLIGALLLAGVLLSMAPASSPAAITTFGSPLKVPATLNTAEDLDYPGTLTPVPPSPDAPNGIFHTFHYGVDTALWNVAPVNGDSRVPATGQALKVSLEGCAQQVAGGPPPLTQTHFQDISPLPDGGAKVNLTSQPFEIPVCGQNGASGATVSTYEPVNLCVSAGDYVAFNDDGGYVENVYRAGVPYQVLGAVAGSTTASFLKDGGTGNGATLSPSQRAANDGFSTNHNAELMLRVTLGTGHDATHICSGGSGGLSLLPPISVKPQTDGVNHDRIVAVAVYCRLSPGCKGVATMTLPGANATVGRSGFSLLQNRTAHVHIRLSSRVISMIRAHHGVSTTLTAVVGATTVNQTISVKIF
jgi:hypothetical protein